MAKHKVICIKLPRMLGRIIGVFKRPKKSENR